MTPESDHCFGQSVTADQVILFVGVARTAAVEYDDCNLKGCPNRKSVLGWRRIKLLVKAAMELDCDHDFKNQRTIGNG
jgi:hypothetical protein